MPFEARLLTGLAVAVAVVYWATPLAIRVADRYDFYDRPRDYKGHAAPTPYLGGAALVAGFVAALLLLTAEYERTLWVTGGVVALWVIGTIDDRHDVAWWLRVIVELSLAGLLWWAGLGWDLGVGGAVDLGLTALWVVAVVNAFNLFDNMDGQSATMGLVTASGLATLGIVDGNSWLAVASVALAGACFGFLPHNLLAQPARIFLGDGGSMPLGFAVAALAMIGAGDTAPAWQAVALGLLLVGVPALDTTLVVVSRRRRGLSVLTAGRDHLTHRARQRLRTAFSVAIALGSVQIVLSLMAVAATRGSTPWLAGAAIVYLMLLAAAVALIDTRIPAVPPAVPAPASVTDVAPSAQLGWLPREAPLLVLIGVGAGVSPFFAGYYSAGVWAPLGLGLIACLLAVGIARPPRAGVEAWVALAGLVGLGLWALLSSLWADSVEQAVVSGNRTLALGALLGLLLLLVRDRRTAMWALGSFAATAVVVELWQVVLLLSSSGPDQFLGERLNDPLGYINAQATFSILALWPLMALAEQRRSALAAGAGLAGVTLTGGLVLLSQSRGAGLAVIGSVLLVLAIAPGRQRRAFGLAAALAGVLFASGELLAIGDSGTVTTDALRTGMTGLLVAAAAVGVLWGVAVAVVESLDVSGRATARAVATGTLIAAALVLALAAGVKAGSIDDKLSTQYDAFVNLSPEQGGEQTASRLLSGAGNRYDYWRISENVWQEHKLLGVGAGNYDEPYFLQRTTAEDVRQPHSLLLQALSELGLPGLLLVVAFLGAVVAGALRRRAEAASSDVERGLLVAALGMFAAWAVHTQVDWIHLLPGITAGAVIAAAVLLRRPEGAVAQPQRLLRPGRRALVAALITLPVAVAGVSLSRQVLGQHYAGQARDELAAGRPEAAIRTADRALRLDNEALPVYYTKAAAIARLGDAVGAEQTLLQATRIEPGDFLPYALLGDLSVRRRRFDEAADYYRQSAARNPREPALAQLVQNPRAAATE